MHSEYTCSIFCRIYCLHTPKITVKKNGNTFPVLFTSILIHLISIRTFFCSTNKMLFVCKLLFTTCNQGYPSKIYIRWKRNQRLKGEIQLNLKNRSRSNRIRSLCFVIFYTLLCFSLCSRFKLLKPLKDSHYFFCHWKSQFTQFFAIICTNFDSHKWIPPNEFLDKHQMWNRWWKKLQFHFCFARSFGIFNEYAKLYDKFNWCIHL